MESNPSPVVHITIDLADIVRVAGFDRAREMLILAKGKSPKVVVKGKIGKPNGKGKKGGVA